MTRNFLTGFACGLLIFIAINLLAAQLNSDCGLSAVLGLDACADDIARAGWPLQVYEQGGFIYRSSFNPLFLIINILIALAFSALTGWGFASRKRPLSK